MMIADLTSFYRKRTVSGETAPLTYSCTDRRIPFAVQYLQHVLIRIQIAGYCHGKQSGGAAAKQHDVLLVHTDRLLLIAALNIPEYQLRQLITVPAVQVPGIIEVGAVRIQGTTVEFHVCDDIERFRQLFLGQMIADSRIQNQFENFLDIGISHFIVAHAVFYLFHQVSAFDFHQFGGVGEGNEVIAERSFVSFSKVHAQ